MDYTNFNWTELSDYEPFEAACEVVAERPRERYSLALALKIVRQMETSPTRGAVFTEIKNKNFLYRIVDAAYESVDAVFTKPLVLFLYMLKCATSIGPRVSGSAEAVSIANFGNEQHTVERFTSFVPGRSIHRLSLNRRNMLYWVQISVAWHLFRVAPRVWRFLSKLAARHSFMPSARIASGLAYYIRFSQLLRANPQLNAVVVASNYSPEALGLSAAAHKEGRKVIYFNHAPVPANGALIPPVLADCAVFYGDAIRQTYDRHSRCVADVVLVGQPGVARPMEWQSSVQKVGIFLTALTRPETVTALVEAISVSQPQAKILIRNHPVGLLKSDFKHLAERFSNLEITLGNPLDDEISACDLVFCGNSGVAMNILRSGRPVAYVATLDALNYDYNGFVARKLVYEAEGWGNDLYFQLQTFYANAKWRAVMRSYDASYGADKSELERAAAIRILPYLS